MRRSILSLSLILALALGGTVAAGAAGYDAPAVRQAMGRSVGLLGDSQKALGAKNWKALGTAFKAFADIGAQMAGLVPPQGSPELWKSIWKDFSAAALAGQEAAGKKDAGAAQEALDKLNLLMQQGHREFR